MGRWNRLEQGGWHCRYRVGDEYGKGGDADDNEQVRKELFREFEQ